MSQALTMTTLCCRLGTHRTPNGTDHTFTGPLADDPLFNRLLSLLAITIALRIALVDGQLYRVGS